MKSFGVSSSFLRRCTVSASSERTYACRSWTWISYSVSRRRVLESDMEAGRNFENPSRLGLLFLSNSFIAHPFSRVCAARPRALASCSKYRRLEKRKSRLAAYLPSVESLNLQDFFPHGPLRARSACSFGRCQLWTASFVPLSLFLCQSERLADAQGSTYIRI